MLNVLEDFLAENATAELNSLLHGIDELLEEVNLPN